MPSDLGMARWCLQRRATTAVAAAALFVGGLGLASLLPTTFMPLDDDPQTEVTLTLPPGSELAETVANSTQLTSERLTLHAALRERA